MTTQEELISMKKDISTIGDKMDNLNGKLDRLTERLLDPDVGGCSKSK